MGSCRRLLNYKPLFVISLIKCITLASLHSHYIAAPLSHRESSFSELTDLILFYLLVISSALVLYFYLASVLLAPGYVPTNWHLSSTLLSTSAHSIRSAADQMDGTSIDVTYQVGGNGGSHEMELQYCHTCASYKAPRSHHCRTCNRCVMKMDHHCLWINNCVGFHNHAHFILFLLFAAFGSCSAAFTIIHAIYNIYHKARNVYLVYITFKYVLIWWMFSVGLAVSVVIALSILLYSQIKGMLNNETYIESWIIDKAVYRRYHSFEHIKEFTNPYNIGARNNTCFMFSQLVNTSRFATDDIRSDGIIFPVRSGCDQFTLTREQLAQKREKRLRLRAFHAVKQCTGYWINFQHGFCTLVHPPCPNEYLLSLNVGDTVLVSRYKRYWMYGEILSDSKHMNTNRRGWFPSACVVLSRAKTE